VLAGGKAFSEVSVDFLGVAASEPFYENRG
jgi:hypothetical protein